MLEEIGFGESGKKAIPPLQDIEEKEMRDKAIKGLEQQQVKEQVGIEAGIVKEPSGIEAVPKEVPYLFFHYGSKVLKCDRFQTDDEENRIIARHLSILIGVQNSKVWSLVVIILVIVGKIVGCWESIKNWRKGKDEEPKPSKAK